MFRSLRAVLGIALVLAVVAIPLAGAEEGGFRVPEEYLEHLSSSVDVTYYVHHPTDAPKHLGRGVAQLQSPPARTTARSSQYCTSNANKDVFNCDFIGFPQNEESVGSCPTNDQFVLGSTNDYNGILFGDNDTGWEWSTDGGHSVRNYGFLPPVVLNTLDTHPEVPSGGAPAHCTSCGRAATRSRSFRRAATRSTRRAWPTTSTPFRSAPTASPSTRRRPRH